MRRRHVRVCLPAILLAGCTFTSSTTDPNLPGVAGTSSDLARAQFAAMMVGAVRTTLDSWSQAVRRQGGRTLEAHYTEDAAVVQPDSDFLKGADAMRLLASALQASASDANASLLDVEVSDGIAYVYGAYDIAPARAGTEASRGYHVTVLRQRGDDWAIRTQLFDPRTASRPFLDVPGETEVGMIEIGTTASGRVPREDFAGAVTLIAGFTRSWEEGDVRTMREAFADGALLQLPGAEVAARGGAVPAAMDSARVRWASFRTTELDYTASGRIGVMLGRYTLGDAPAGVAGHYIMVVSREGNDWRIRSLVLD